MVQKLQKMPVFLLFFRNGSACPAELAAAGCKTRAAGASGRPPEIAKLGCLTCAAHAERRARLEEGEAMTGGIYVP